MSNDPSILRENAPLDMARLADVLRGSELTELAFLAEFRRSTDADVDQLLDAVRTGAMPQVERLAHRIEGAGRVIGAGSIAAASCTVAQVSQSGDDGALQAAVAALLACRQSLYACFESRHPALALPASGGHSHGVCEGLVFLVVEDHEFQRGMIVRLLRQLGAIEVQGFADGASALVAARELGAPAVVVLDLDMPDLNGMEVMRIAGQEQLALSVIVNSALSENLLRWPLHTGRSYGTTVLGAIAKPLTAAKLAPLLAQYRHDLRQAPRSRRQSPAVPVLSLMPPHAAHVVTAVECLAQTERMLGPIGL